MFNWREEKDDAPTGVGTTGEPIKLSRRNTAEKNRKVLERACWNNPDMADFRQTIKERFNFDLRQKDFNPHLESFNWGKFKRKILRETNSASANTALLRAGVQTAVNNLYPAVPITYDKWTHVIQSNKDTELYAPLNALTFFGEIGEGETFPEASVLGMDLKLRNKKFGQMFPVSFELLDDDQTGQFAQKVGDMADYAALFWEVWVYGKFAGLAGKAAYGGLTVPACETTPSTESTFPWNNAFTVGGGSNKPSSYGSLTTTNIQSAFVALDEQLNLQGLKMNVKPDTIICGPYNRFNLATILNSNFYPAGAQTAGVTGGSLAINVLEGIAQPVVSRFVFDNNGSSLNSKAWYVADTSKPAFVVQMREAAKITQENPESGAGFEREIYRWKVKTRGNADFIDPRFFYQGDDGSV